MPASPALLDGWRLAVGTLTALPVTAPSTVDRRRAGLAMCFAPLALVPVAVVVVAVLWMGHWLGLPLLVIALLGLGVVILGNRGFHLDGLSDTVDGLAASYDRERSLTVMKSGTSGPAGTTALIVVIGLQAAGLAALLTSTPRLEGAVLAGAIACVSRVALVACCARGVPSARPGGLGDPYTQTVPVPVAALLWLCAAAVLAAACGWAGLEWWRGPAAVGAALAVVLLLLARTVKRFGGVTGDVFGACVELALAAMLVALSWA